MICITYTASVGQSGLNPTGGTTSAIIRWSVVTLHGEKNVATPRPLVFRNIGKRVVTPLESSPPEPSSPGVGVMRPLEGVEGVVRDVKGTARCELIALVGRSLRLPAACLIVRVDAVLILRSCARPGGPVLVLGVEVAIGRARVLAQQCPATVGHVTIDVER